MSITIITILVYLAAMFGIAWYVSRHEGIEAYFLNTKSTGLWFMTFSTVATVVGAGATIAVVAEVYDTGISYGLALVVSFVVGMILFGILSPKIKELGDKYEARSIVDFFGSRFGQRNYKLAAAIQLILLTIWVAVQAIGVSSLASVLTGFDYATALYLSAAVTIIYTAMGGLKVDIVTDFIQFWIIVVTFVAMAIIGYLKIGSIGALIGQLPVGHLNPFNYGGVSWVVGTVLISGFLYIGNATHWQRIFSAESTATARKSFFIAAPIAGALGVIIVFLGLLAADVLPTVPKANAIFSLMTVMLPHWMIGLGFASILAVVMSSVDSLIVAGSTIIHSFLYKGDEAKYKDIKSARWFTFAFGLFGYLLAFIVPDIVALSLLVSYLALIFVPAIFAGIYSAKTSNAACFYSILLPTIILFVLNFYIPKQVFLITTPLSILIILFYDKLSSLRQTTLKSQ